MKTELTYLAYVTILTGLLWLPYVLDRIVTVGLLDAVGYPTVSKPMSGWAERLKKAHLNAVENLVVFATLVLIAVASGVSSSLVASACMLYFWARLVHVLAYAFAVPWVRTLAFTAGFVAQVMVAWQLLFR